ncbi:AP-3 complex subunit delta-1-like isoform X2 [Gigantopelta aegis]|uniref:AP-3 complex subunit delta-1-like isoform X2 n=1 Tax=Gigantopelta aegis TaxID=1735272 RepID=UPI001B88C37A|nr:AP-3 complex subunit delta-1-like isoform X2 [Gigantopelta aegis]
MALKKVKGTLERALDKNVQDLVRGIRNHKETESKYIAECVDEIKQELKQENLAVKANAVNKLTYLQMLGYDISWAAFNIIEVMSSTKFTFKRVGYLAASQCFHDGTDVLMLTTNMIRKDLSSQQMYDAGVALNGLSCFITSDLARDLANDIMTLMASSRPHLRKKAVLIMYKVFLQFPEALRPAFHRLKEKLEDPDPGVQSAAVNVICELARKNPKNYLSLAPLFFKLMTSSTNNWVLIKIIKLFGALTPLEPRLGKKLIEPLTNLIHSTSAMSLLYECINTVIAGIPNHTASIQLCVQKLRILIEDSDQNLKYLGLLAMSKILATHPKSVQAHKDLVMQCLDDKDESIRLRALDLLYGMVSKKNLMEIVKKLMVHMDKAEGSHYRDELLAKIVLICSQSNYQYVTNFEWYVSILVELTRMEGTRHGKMIASQMLDVAIRVQAIRHFAVSQMAILLENSHALANNSQRNGICEVLYAAAWICGEFSEHLQNPKATLEYMLRPKITTLPGHIQSVYVQNIIKLYSKVVMKGEVEEDAELIKEVNQLLLDKLPIFVQSSDLEVQERACTMLQLVKYTSKLQDKGVKVADELESLSAGDLNPVALKAQRKVPVPEGLDLDAYINRPPSDSSDDDIQGASFFTMSTDEHRPTYQYEGDNKVYEPTEDELEKLREARKFEVEHNPHYLKGETKRKGKKYDASNIDDIPVARIDLSVPLHVPGVSPSDKYLMLPSSERKGKKSKKGKKKRKKGGHGGTESDEDVEAMHAVSTVVDMPEGVNLSDKDDNDDNLTDPFRKLDINLDEPLRDDEKLPIRTHHIVPESSQDRDLDAEEHKKKSKKKHKKDKEKTKKKDKGTKERKRSKSGHKEKDQPSLLLATSGMENGVETAVNENAGDFKSVVDNIAPSDKIEDIEFWLSGSDAAATPSPSKEEKTVENHVSHSPEITVNDVLSTEEDDNVKISEEKSKKKKKEKRTSTKDKKLKKEKKKREKEKRNEYEEPEGITTPSKENLSISQLGTPMETKLPPMSSYKLLGENASIKMTYETRVTHQRSDQIIVSIIFNNLTSHHVKDMEFNVLDTLNTKLIRGMGQSHHDAVKVPFTLLPGSQNEGQFAFSIDSITMPQRMRGTLTYIVKSDEGSTHDKLDFKINLPCSSYLMTTPCKSADFATLLGSGDLSAKSSVNITPVDTEFSHIIAKLCFFLHFRLVEQVEKSASLYSKTIQDHPVCLLVKMNDGSVSLDGKSTDGTLLSNVLDDAKQLLTDTS